MSDLQLKEHALSAFITEHKAAVQSNDCLVDIEIVPFLSHVNLRMNHKNANHKSQIEAALGQPLPVIANTVTRQAHSVYWLGPSEWLVVSNDQNIVEQLRQASAGFHNGVTALHGGQILLKISGPKAVALLAKGCTLDLHERQFKLGDCAQSTFAKAAALVSVIDQAPTFELIVRRSFVDYVARWLNHAGQEFGVSFTQISAGQP